MKTKLTIPIDLKSLVKEIDLKRSSINRMVSDAKLDKIKNNHLLRTERKNLARMLTKLNQIEIEEK